MFYRGNQIIYNFQTALPQSLFKIQIKFSRKILLSRILNNVLQRNISPHKFIAIPYCSFVLIRLRRLAYGENWETIY